MSPPLRTRAAAVVARLGAAASRRAGAGGGSVIGGRAALLVDPRSLERLAEGHRVALVTGTNGKTTTTRLLAAALAAGGEAASNPAGANLLSGLVMAFAAAPPGTTMALEVDEALLGQASAAVRPEVVVLLNLSRDQLDRAGEVRRHAERWRQVLAQSAPTMVVANADDPLVAWAAWEAHAHGRVVWVHTGGRWHDDAATCSACGGRVVWDEHAPPGGWACSACDFRRPDAHFALDADDLVIADGRRLPVTLRIPGRFNKANAVMAAAAADILGVEIEAALGAMAVVGTVAGRYADVDVDGVSVRLLLAKNPAGWAEILELLARDPKPVVIGINARVPDGRDPSWLWDVPFERLAGRPVVATGDRGRDLAVRLRYAEVDHRFVEGYRAAVAAAASSGIDAGGTGAPAEEIDLAANYTSFQDARKEFGA